MAVSRNGRFKEWLFHGMAVSRYDYFTSKVKSNCQSELFTILIYYLINSTSYSTIQQCAEQSIAVLTFLVWAFVNTFKVRSSKILPMRNTILKKTQKTKVRNIHKEFQKLIVPQKFTNFSPKGIKRRLYYTTTSIMSNIQQIQL